MSSDVLKTLREYTPPGSATKFYLDLCNKVDLLVDDPKKDMLTRSVQGIARFIATAIAVPFFCLVGFIYNGCGVLLKGGLGIFESLRQNEKGAKVYFIEAVKHGAFLVTDIPGKFFSTILGVLHAVVPNHLNGFYGMLSDKISSIENWSLSRIAH